MSEEATTVELDPIPAKSGDLTAVAEGLALWQTLVAPISSTVDPGG